MIGWKGIRLRSLSLKLPPSGWLFSPNRRTKSARTTHPVKEILPAPIKNRGDESIWGELLVVHTEMEAKRPPAVSGNVRV